MTYKKPLLILAAVAAIAAPLAVCAQQTQTLPAAGAPAVADGVTSLTLAVTERIAVKQDVVVANVRYEAKGTDAKTVQNEINQKIEAGLAAIKGDKDVKIATEAYQVYMNQNQVQEMHDGKPVITQTEEWRGSQAITLQSSNADAVKSMTGKLQYLGFAVGQLQYTLSPEKSEEVRQTLMKGAVDKIKAQADQAAKLLGKKGYEIREVNVDGGYMPPMPMYAKAMRMEASGAASDMAAPNVEAGESDVTMTLNARVELK